MGTDISIAGKPATCAQLAPYCKYAQFKKQVSKSCPKTCGVCKDTSASASSGISSGTESKVESEKSEPKKAEESAVAESKPCKDIEGETEISIAGKPATCAQLTILQVRTIQ